MESVDYGLPTIVNALSTLPRPSYEDGELRDPRIEELQKRAAEDGDDQLAGLLKLLKAAVPQNQPSSRMRAASVKHLIL